MKDKEKDKDPDAPGVPAEPRPPVEPATHVIGQDDVIPDSVPKLNRSMINLHRRGRVIE